MSGASPPPVIVLMGPTASGKTGLALALADHMPVEIISVDSAQVYRDMDIGTAKPSVEMRARVPHHLIDILDPAESYSAARFAEDARRLIAEIRHRGRTPLLVGGTMLYFRALIDGLSELPSADPALRARIEAQARAEGWPALHARLSALDPQTARRLHPNDQQRIQRALEIVELTGRPMSALKTRPCAAGIEGRVCRFVLMPHDRAWLHARIRRRLEEMLAQGFLDEVRRLRARGDLTPDLPSMRAVGYRQLWAYLDGECSLDEAIQRALAATRQYAKRQLTWLRSERDAQVLDPQAPQALEALLRSVVSA
ncbi:tRNA dimethylallyltransferase [Fontimonas thermophila]|uniref:tRNA dimethylallyltransferase n=1 Tax=Fontimonas thermophila TaxID=1076937 RepID=A0A1I2HMP0_9GAMM|nr:tRNA (adenosine(37)-N6)-dimethylallyltransferase MiaA [Fontimonas thermophila]SFF30703.1 tRNA dimethylallyltransferase [Fontimonas thermophila]